MIDHLFGRPSPSWKRLQVFLVIFFWIWRILRGNREAPRLLWLRPMNRLLKRFTPWQIIVSTLTGVYAVRNLDKILGLNAPEPLARLYSPSYYRATWIITGLDAGFASALSIRTKWLRDISSILFSIYYVIYANEADEKLRKFRAVPTVEMLRATWEKVTNPYIRFLTPFPSVTHRRKILLPRPKSSAYTRPITAYLFFHNPNQSISETNEIILDFPGGGFVAMTPEHHEERLRLWARRTGRVVLSIDYGKAPEYPYPFAIDEAYDVYRLLVESGGQIIGISGKNLNIIISGDSAGAAIAVNIVFKILESHTATPTSEPSVPLQKPLALVLSYAALDFNFTSWMTPANLRVLRIEQEQQESGRTDFPGLRELVEVKDHLRRVSVLSMVPEDKRRTRRASTSSSKRVRRNASWKDTFRGFGSANEDDGSEPPSRSRTSLRRGSKRTEDKGTLADDESGSGSEPETNHSMLKEEDRPIQARVRFVSCLRSRSQPQELERVQTLDAPKRVTKKRAGVVEAERDHGSRRENSFPRSGSALEKQQQALSVAVAEADHARKGKKFKGEEPVGTRLTMTSRAGYFLDRIVSPTMMRSMALLYLGPHRNPDFSTDYRVSPILAPDQLLAQFPPLLMQCGEKDPFVDDTVIFAGRVREAKRARLVELETLISNMNSGKEDGKRATLGESLRMTSIASSGKSSSGERDNDAKLLANLRREREKLASESEEDWVQMDLFSDWSHGYLQMPMLMSEIKGVIEDLGDWIDDAFERLSPSPLSPPNEPKPFGNLGPVGAETCANKLGRKQSPPRVERPSTIKPSSPVISETETETETEDSRITFVPKRYTYQGGPQPDQQSSFLGTAWTVDDGSTAQTRAALTSSPEPGLVSCSTEKGESEVKIEKDSAAQKVGAAVAGSPPKAGSAMGKAGPLISETELMRRRRLLDAHIFE